MGVPPSGGFVAKWLLLLATVMEGQWWWAVVMLVGGLLAGGYVLMVLGKAMGSGTDADRSRCAHACLGAVRWWRWRLRYARSCSASCRCEPSELLQIGRPTARGSQLHDETQPHGASALPHSLRGMRR